MEAGLFISKPEIINNNNNNNHNKNSNMDFDLPKKKWSNVSSLSSLSEGSNFSNGNFRSTENLSFSSTKLYQRRESIDVPIIKEEEKEKKKSRRKSWHVGKFEKKRRKGISMLGSLNLGSTNHSSSSTSPTGFERHKRFSWWNIFVPDHWPKSRRSSTDFTKLPTEKIPYLRGKSRSVDHGFSSPFDLDSLRSKVESRFESVDRLCKDADGDSRSGSKEQLADKKMPKPPPTRTITYKVESNDTLTSVAARFDTTPSELAILNRLPSRTVFPGQIIKVPDKKSTSSQDGDNIESTSEGADSTSGGDDVNSEPESSHVLSETDTKDTEATIEDDMLETLRPSSPKPGHAERIHSPAPIVPHRRNIERFLKINVRHVTDGQGVVSGVLLVTPNAIMFDPNVSDQLVIEHGPESYGVIAPMEFVVNAAIYHDIAHMRVANTQNTQSDSNNKPEIYHTEVKECERLYRPKEEQSCVAPVEVAAGSGSESQLVTKETDSFDSSSLDLCSPGKLSSQPSSGHSIRRDYTTPKDETFSELCCKSSEDSSICSCEDERDTGNAFPKAFDREIMEPSYYCKRTLKRSDELSEKDEGSHSGEDRRTDSPISLASADREENTDTTMPHLVEAETVIRNLEERRKSSLDHHWAVPNKIKSIESENQSRDDGQEEQGNNDKGKPSCHDSGIDIRDPSLMQPPRIAKKFSYSDADILLADTNEFVPPIPVKQLSRTEDDNTNQKKTSVSFSLDENKDCNLDKQSSKSSSNEDSDKQQAESKKNKMLKRLSYPLAWMEGITGEKDDKESLPSSAESSHPSHSSSVFSKVFSSSPINMVTDFGSGLFLTKTPSEESGNKFQFPPSNLSNSSSGTVTTNLDSGHFQRSLTSTTSTSISSEPPKREGFSTFSPSSIIHSVGRSSVSSFIRQQHHSARSDSTKSAGPRLDYRSMVSVEDMPELFVSFDIHAPMFPHLDHLELIPRPARSCEDPPLYLRLRMGKPKNRKIPKTTPIMSYGKKKMRPEYWFSVPRNRVDDLYRFLNLWVPHLYGDLDEKVVEERNYELVNSDTEIWDDEENTTDEKKHPRQNSDELGDLTRESWEVIKAPYAKIYHLLKNQADQFGSSDTQPSDEVLSMSEELRRALYASNANSLDLELFLPELNGTTEILTEDHRKQLCRHLPARAEGYTWTLVFSTSQNGFSLNSMYRKMNRIDSPILMVIQDTDCNVFGTITSCALKVSDHFYGNGESFLFTFTPEFQVYNWTGENLYFIKGNNESLSIGSGDGKFGIWLDGDLYQGRTEACTTYGNEPLVPHRDFVVKTLECWAFL